MHYDPGKQKAAFALAKGAGGWESGMGGVWGQEEGGCLSGPDPGRRWDWPG